MKLNVIRDDSVDYFLTKAGSLLYQDEPTNSLMLGLCGNISKAKEPPKFRPILLRIVDGTETVSAAIQTPPMNLVLTYMKDSAIEVLVSYLFENQIQFPGVVGPARESELFTTMWSSAANKTSSLGMGQRIYKVESVSLPNVSGFLRLATSDEIDLIANWLVEFSNESLPPPERKSFEERRLHAAKSIDNKLAYVWEDNNQVVSMAHIGRPTKGGISVSAVYTPVNRRKCGYASAVVAHLSSKMLNSGKQFCVLYTDLSNPTSNKIYQNVGYIPVSDSKHFLFQEIK